MRIRWLMKTWRGTKTLRRVFYLSGIFGRPARVKANRAANEVISSHFGRVCSALLYRDGYKLFGEGVAVQGDASLGLEGSALWTVGCFEKAAGGRC